MTKYMLVSFKTCPWVQRSAIVFREKNTEFEAMYREGLRRRNKWVSKFIEPARAAAE